MYNAQSMSHLERVERHKENCLSLSKILVQGNLFVVTEEPGVQGASDYSIHSLTFTVAHFIAEVC